MTPTVQVLPPGIASGARVCEPAFGERGRHPVSAELVGDGEFSSPGIAFEDYSRMRVRCRRLAPGRTNGTPHWAVNTTEMRALLVRFMEARAGIREPGTGSHIQRLNAAQRKILTSVPRKVEVLDRLMREYQAVKHADPARARMLESQIQNLDTVIRTAREGAGLVTRMVYLYYRCGLSSAQVGTELGISPRTIRQTIYRLHRLAERIEAEK